MDEVDLTETALEALGVDVPAVVQALRAGSGLPEPIAVALGTDLAAGATTGPESAAIAMALAAHRVDHRLLADIAVGLSGPATGERSGVAHLADHAPTGSAGLAIAARAAEADIGLTTLGAPPAFDATARSVGAASIASITLRCVAGMLSGGVRAALIDLHLGADLDLATAEQAAAAIGTTADALGLTVTVRTFRIRVPLGRVFGVALEPLEAAAVLGREGPTAMQRFVDDTVVELARLDGRTVDVPPGGSRSSMVPVDADTPVRQLLLSPTAGSVLRLDAATLVAVSRLVSGVRVLRTVGESVGRNDGVLEVLGHDDVTVDRAVDALRGSWAIGPGGAPGPDPTPISVVRGAIRQSDSSLFFGT